MSRLRTISLVLIFILVTGFGISRITLNVDVLALLPQDQPEVKGVQVFYRHFSRPDELVITLEGDHAGQAAEDLAAELERHVELLDSVVWNLPLQSDPQAAADLLAYLWFNAEPTEVETLKSRLAPQTLETGLAEVVEELSTGLLDQDAYLRAYDPLGLVAGLPGGLTGTGLDPSAADSAFSSVDERFHVLYVKSAQLANMDYQQADQWMDKIRAVVGGWQKSAFGTSPGGSLPKIAYTGEPAFVAEIGTGMERDMRLSVTSTIVLICLLFWILHRRLMPLFWLVAMLAVVFGLTLAIGSLLIGELSIMSVGFAAILIGLTIDYGVILYKEARLTPGDPAALRRLVGPSIIWAATTTAAVFFALQLSSFPGVAQLGVLVAVGVLVGSVVMLLFYAPVAARSAVGDEAPVDREGGAGIQPAPAQPRWVVAVSLAVPLGSALLLAIFGFPGFAADFKPMQLSDSPSMDAMEEMGRRLNLEDGTQPLVVEAGELAEVPEKLKVAGAKLKAAVASGALSSFLLPEALVPNLHRQRENRKTLATLINDEPRLLAAIEAAGFNEEAELLGKQVFASWRSWLEQAEAAPILPRQASGQWMLNRLFSVDGEGQYALLGKVTPGRDPESTVATTARLAGEGIHITGWETLDPAIQRLIRRDSLRVFLPAGLVLVAMLSFIFRDWRDLVISLATLAFSIGALLAITAALRIEWDAFSLSSIPILFGVGLDYSIHMIFALRRSEGDLQAIRLGISRAILFCGLSTAVGFGSLSLASNLGLASIGRICGLGVLIIMLTTIGLLPFWWHRIRRATNR